MAVIKNIKDNKSLWEEEEKENLYELLVRL